VETGFPKRSRSNQGKLERNRSSWNDRALSALPVIAFRADDRSIPGLFPKTLSGHGSVPGIRKSPMKPA
jgi:hypothetical protein